MMDHGIPFNQLFRLEYFKKSAIYYSGPKFSMATSVTNREGSPLVVGQWYKITVSGSPDGDQCQQELIIEGPGLRGYFPYQGYVDGKWRFPKYETACPKPVPETSAMKAYATSYKYTPMDGVLRNLIFTNKDDDTITVSPCSKPEPPACGCYAKDEEIAIESNKCILDLGTSADTAGDWSLTFEFKANSMPDGPTDPRYFFYILQGIDSHNFIFSLQDFEFHFEFYFDSFS